MNVDSWLFLFLVCWLISEVDLALYHYCSNDAFFSIIRNREVWLSSLSLSNDSMEGRLLSWVMSRLASADGMDAGRLAQLSEHVKYLENYFDGLGFCLSEDGDLLSQWRGYVADGEGVSIGFSREYLERLGERSRGAAARSTPESVAGFSLKKVVYDEEDQRRLIEPVYLEIKQKILDGAFDGVLTSSLLIGSDEQTLASKRERADKALRELSVKILMLFGTVFAFKSQAFAEEREWRLVSTLVRAGDKFEVRPVLNKLLPFRRYALDALDINEVEEIVLGPKNSTPEHVVKSFMESHGLRDVRIIRSAATYR